MTCYFHLSVEFVIISLHGVIGIFDLLQSLFEVIDVITGLLQLLPTQIQLQREGHEVNTSYLETLCNCNIQIHPPALLYVLGDSGIKETKTV